MTNSVIRTRSTARIFLVCNFCIYLLNYFINRKFPAVKQSFLGTKVPGDESSRERKFHWTFVPGVKSSTLATKAPGDESSWYHYPSAWVASTVGTAVKWQQRDWDTITRLDSWLCELLPMPCTDFSKVLWSLFEKSKSKPEFFYSSETKKFFLANLLK